MSSMNCSFCNIQRGYIMRCNQDGCDICFHVSCYFVYYSLSIVDSKNCNKEIIENVILIGDRGSNARVKVINRILF